MCIFRFFFQKTKQLVFWISIVLFKKLLVRTGVERRLTSEEDLLLLRRTRVQAQFRSPSSVAHSYLYLQLRGHWEHTHAHTRDLENLTYF